MDRQEAAALAMALAVYVAALLGVLAGAALLVMMVQAWR